MKNTASLTFCSRGAKGSLPYFCIWLVILFGLASSPVYAADMLPKWVQNPQPDTSEALWGTGSGGDFESAKKQALTDIAGKFNTVVEESVQDVVRRENDSVDELLEIVRSSQVAPTELSDFHVTRSEELGGVIWVEVKLDKEAYGKRIVSKYEAKKKRLERDLERFNTRSSLEQVIRSGELIERCNRLAYANAQAGYATGVSNQKDTAFYNDWLSGLHALRDNHSIALVALETPPQYSSLITGKLAGQGVKVSVAASDPKGSGKPERDQSAIQLSSRTEAYQEKDRGAHVFKVEIVLKSLDGNGNVIAEATYPAKGRAYDSAASAEAKALSSLDFRLRGKTLVSLLNLPD